MEIDLTLVWAVLIAGAVFLYVVMDGFDLGLGILFPLVRGKSERDVMVNSVAPVWDGNETWLVFGGGALFGVFPLAYATVLPALYMPLMLMLLALIFRGVSFEMRFRVETERARLWWDRAFSYGSIGATACQGVALGAFVQGIRVENRAYAGGWWDWLTPFSVLTAAALIIGYGWLGACWLIWKTEGELQDRFRKLALPLAGGTLAAIGAVSLWMMFISQTFRDRWLHLPGAAGAAIVPVLVLLVAWRFRTGLRRREHVWPFFCALAVFLLSYIGLGISMFPHIVPPDVTIWDAANPRASQVFLLVGASVLIPVILAYTVLAYWLFRGKVAVGAGYH